VYVHFVLCDGDGEWVIVDSQDEYGEDFEALSPETASDCDKLVTIRLLRHVVPPKVTGIGANLRKDASGDLLVVGVAEKGPAAEAGVRAGDVIIAVEGQAVRKLTINEAVSRITGEAGTEVDITIRRDTETLEFTITRREVVYE
jgi:C-terminal processing protease CtpA/Prc